MPNYVSNLVTFGEDAAAKAAFQRMLEAVRVDGGPLGSITFDKIIPMPEDIRRTMGIPVTDGEPAWRVWCERNWGTDRDAVDWYPADHDSDTMCFFTAWIAVPQIITALSKMYPEQTVSYQWAEHENIGQNVGKMVLKNGKTLSGHIPEDESREAFEMAAEILDIRLADFGFYLTADQSAYEYRETAPP